MINLHPFTNSPVSIPGEGVGFYKIGPFAANVLTPIAAANPYINIGVMPFFNDTSAGRAISVQLDNMGGVTREIEIAPAYNRIAMNFNAFTLFTEISNCFSIAETLARAIHPRTIGSAIFNRLASNTGFYLYTLLHHEVKEANPIQLGQIPRLGAAGSLINRIEPWLQSFYNRSYFQMGMEPFREQTPVYYPRLENPFSIGDPITILRDISYLYSNFEDSNIPSAVQRTPAVSTPPARLIGFLDNLYTESWFNFTLDLQNPEKMIAAIESLKGSIKLDFLNDVAMSQTIEHAKISNASSLVLFYYMITPLLFRIKTLIDVLECPIYAEVHASANINLLEHPKYIEFKNFISTLKLPFIYAEIETQIKGLSFNTNGEVFNCTMIEESLGNIALPTPQTFRAFVYESNLIEEFIQLNRLMSSHYLSKDIITQCGATLGHTSRSVSTTVKLRPDQPNDFTVTDGYLSSVNIPDYVAASRSHLVTPRSDTEAFFGWKGFIYDEGHTDRLRAMVPDINITEVLGRHLIDFTQQGNHLNTEGRLEYRYPLFFVAKAVLDDRLIAAGSWSRAARLAPYNRMGIPTSDDTMMYKIDTVAELREFCGFFSIDDVTFVNMPYVRRLVYMANDNTYRLVDEDLISGSTPIKLLTHSMVAVIPIFSHVHFMVYHKHLRTFRDHNTLPIMVASYIPVEMSNFMKLMNGVKLDIFGPIFNTVKVIPSVMIDVIQP